MNKKVYVLGGGTMSHVRNHMALCAPAYGNTARTLKSMCDMCFTGMDTELHLTKMAGGTLETNQDVESLVDDIILENTTKIIFFNVALCDFDGKVGLTPSGKYSKRLESRLGVHSMHLLPSEKIIKKIRAKRKDIFLVAFKTTCGATEDEQYFKALRLMKDNSCNLVLVNDTLTRNNMIVTPEEGVYKYQTDRMGALSDLVYMAYMRTHLSFTRSTVVAGEPVPWNDSQIPDSLRGVINHCVSEGAYKRFRGATTGHFAYKVDDNTFLTSIRKTDFNDIASNGLVKVVTDGPDNVLAYGHKPSVGGQSQRIIFNTFSGLDCIVHFHCPLKEGYDVKIPIRSQFEFECGSHECGKNTSDGLEEVEKGIWCVMLDHHGPNIVFNQDIDPQRVITFIDKNFDLKGTTHGFSKEVINFE